MLGGEGDTGSIFKKIGWFSMLPLAAMLSQLSPLSQTQAFIIISDLWEFLQILLVRK